MKKEEIKNLIEVPGKVRGQVFLTDLGYIKREKGEEGVNSLKRKMREQGNPIYYDKSHITDWYPVGLRAVSLLTIKEVFGWGEKEIFDLGNNAPKFSFVVKMLMKTFLSIKRVFDECPKYWQKHYTVGTLENYQIDEKAKFLILRLHSFKVHPIFCPYLAGYFLRIGQYVIRSKKISIEETKCQFKDNSAYHEYVIRWK